MATLAAVGWFDQPGRIGARALSQQLFGLDPLLTEVRGKRVLDVGCAEGLIALALHEAGAVHVRGVDIVSSHIAWANDVKGFAPCVFLIEDANYYQPQGEYDIVLMLAVLHKLADPSNACARFAAVATSLCVVRLPPKLAPAIVDQRSGNVRHDIGAVMARSGFALERVTRGAFDEWIGYFRRRPHA